MVCTLLSERKLGPHVHGIFPEGRLEEFVEVIILIEIFKSMLFVFFQAVSLLSSEVRDPKISQKVGRLLGEIHQLDMPLVKEPIWLHHTIEQLVNLSHRFVPLSLYHHCRYLADLPHDLRKFELEDDRQIYQELQSVCNFSEEFKNLK